VALIQPNGSLVDLFSGSAAAVVGAFAWNLIWKKRFDKKRPDISRRTAERSAHALEGSRYRNESFT
jgi:uncharacterized membrane protein